MSNNGDRRREIGYHELERAEDEEALQGRAAERGQRDGGGAPRERERPRERSSERTTHLTDRERRERWPIG